MHTRAPLALAVPCLFTALTALSAASACAPRPSPSEHVRARAPLLDALGFALTADGDPQTSAGALSASFDSPVVDVDGALDAYGTAHLAFDDAARDVASATVLGAVDGADLVYAVLFDPDMPWRYVVVAARAASLVDGAVLPLDNDNAAALVVDEETGLGYLASDGALTVTSATLADGGRFVGALSGALHEVTLDSWPQDLFPFTEDGSALDTVAASGAGDFDAVWSERGELAGGAAFALDVEGQPSFQADQASAMPLDALSTAIVLASSADPDRIVVALADTDALVAGAALAFDGFTTGAWLLAADGTQIAFSQGSLTFDAASLVDGGVVSGTLTIAGDGYVIPADTWSGEGEGEGEWEEDCSGIETLAATFTPAQVYIESGLQPGELPEGYDRVLTFTDAGMGMMGLLVSDDVDFSVAAPYAFDVVDYEGRPWPAAALGLATCSMMIDVASGTLTAHVEDGRMLGELVFTAQGATRTLALDVEILTP